MLYYPDLLTHVEQSRRRLSAIMVQACLPTKNPVMDLAPNLSSVSWFENTLVCLEVDTPPFHEESTESLHFVPSRTSPYAVSSFGLYSIVFFKKCNCKYRPILRNYWTKGSPEVIWTCCWLVRSVWRIWVFLHWLVRNVGRGLRHLLVGFWSVGDPGACTVLNWWILH